MHPFTALSATFVAIMSPALINAQSTVTIAVAPAPTGMGCICMAPTSSGKDEAMYDQASIDKALTFLLIMRTAEITAGENNLSRDD
ncbi:hypothetical protein FOFC_16126 [Fusarium oxysporum]|nr:hypothetical protein FOFC_16126 [Fusarium oxysporum]